MLDTFLVPENTLVTAKGDSVPADISAAGNSTFLVTLTVAKVVEQEAIELSVFLSADGTAWETKPLASLAQKFYPGDYPLLINLSQHPSAKFIRAHWEVSRWGRGPTTPEFTIAVRLREVPAGMLREVQAEA